MSPSTSKSQLYNKKRISELLSSSSGSQVTTIRGRVISLEDCALVLLAIRQNIINPLTNKLMLLRNTCLFKPIDFCLFMILRLGINRVKFKLSYLKNFGVSLIPHSLPGKPQVSINFVLMFRFCKKKSYSVYYRESLRVRRNGTDICSFDFSKIIVAAFCPSITK